ncbi:MAG: YgiT-type zinc finger protein [Anaerolineales bacterium]|nr:YgiT-type zinc finger protein [Anaerolineales bacterium]
MEDQKDDKLFQYQEVCTECQTGVLRMQYLTYFTWLNEELVTVPNFPAWVCDVCGRREYDRRAILWLNTLLSHEVGRHSTTRRRPGTARVNQPRP